MQEMHAPLKPPPLNFKKAQPLENISLQNSPSPPNSRTGGGRGGVGVHTLITDNPNADSC